VGAIFLAAARFDRASRLVKAESLTEFCRAAILERADDLLAMKSHSSYRNLQEIPSAEVAEGSERPY
jgi:hypothetical protein